MITVTRRGAGGVVRFAVTQDNRPVADVTLTTGAGGAVHGGMQPHPAGQDTPGLMPWVWNHVRLIDALMDSLHADTLVLSGTDLRVMP